MKKICLFLLCLFSLVFFISCKSNNIVDFTIHTDLQAEYLTKDYGLITQYAKGTEELSIPKPIVLEWNESNDLKVDGMYNLYLTKGLFEDGVVYKTDKNSIEIYNLEINTVYSWKVIGNGNETKIKRFRIYCLNGVRNLYIDGITNARDIGGYVTLNTTVKQGMIFRTSKFNDDESTNVLISDKGIKALKELGIKTELDLRDASKNENGGITVSPLGEDVKYISISMRSGGNYLTLNKEVLKDVFNVLGDVDNYPIVIHCSIGTDRTGLICFLVNAILGVSEKDLYVDYLFSNFGNIYGVRTPSAIKDYLKQIKPYGKDIQSQAYNFLLANGVLQEDLDTIIKIMKNKEEQPE